MRKQIVLSCTREVAAHKDEDVFHSFVLWNGAKVDIASNAKKLGEGAQGVILQGTITKTNEEPHEVAIKCAYAESQKEAELIMEEIKILEMLPPHPSIIKCFGGKIMNPTESHQHIKVYAVLELMKTDLKGHILDNKEFASKCTFGDLLHIFISVADGLSWLHAHSIIHFDLKMNNVLISSTGKAKIADFGSSKTIKGNRQSVTASFRGTQGYIAPEIIVKALFKG